MNRIYKTVFNRTLGLCQVVSELAKGHSRSGRAGGAAGSIDRRILPVLILALGSPGAVWATALPEGGTLVQGSAQISLPDGRTLTIDQHSHKAILNWESFNIGAGNTVNFQQPDASAVALNRVIGNDPSAIYGNLNANGQVFLVNTHGVLFAEGANVNVGGLVASTLDIRDQDFLNGQYTFEGTHPGSVINRGTITADGGAVTLLGGHVSNQGIIHANLGSVALAAGEKITLDFAGDGLINLTIDQGQLNALVENHGVIQADGGSVLLTTHAAGELLNSVVNNTGIVRARTVEQREGKIILLADMQNGTVKVDGTLDASAPAAGDTTGNGGFIDTSAANVQIADSVQVTTLAANGQTGTWLIDPTDFTIYAGAGGSVSGGTAQGSGIGTTTLQNSLATNNVIIETMAASNGSDLGDIHVNAAVSWNAPTTLTLNAHNNIYINAPITVQHAGGGLVFNHGGFGHTGTAAAGTSYYVYEPVSFTAGAGGSFSVNSQSFTLIRNLAQLQNMHNNLSGHYALAVNIDASATASGAGFNPVGGENNPFTGVLDGLGHAITGLRINRPSQNHVGLFGSVGDGSSILHLGLENAQVTGRSFVGSLAGEFSGSVLRDVYATGAVSGSQITGGLLGYISAGYLSNLSTATAVTGVHTGQSSTGNNAGGLAGTMGGGILEHSSASGNVAGFSRVGGLLGMISGPAILRSAYATGDVSATGAYVGGLLGTVSTAFNGSAYIENVFATGSVTTHITRESSGNYWAGGLVARMSGVGAVFKNAYATGTVSIAGTANGMLAGTYVGGAIASLYNGHLENVYATGEVSISGVTAHTVYIGGVVGQWYQAESTLQNVFWDTGTTGIYEPKQGMKGLSTEELFNARNFIGFDFDTVWDNAGGQTTPYLRGIAGNQVFNRHDLPSGTITPENQPAFYNVILDVQQLQAIQNNLSGNYLLGADIDAGATTHWNNGAGFTSIGRTGNAFSGTFDGLGHVIDGLTIHRPDENFVGLFGVALNATIKRVGLDGVDITGQSFVGSLVGRNNGSTITENYATGSVTGTLNNVGGLVGIGNGFIADSYAAVQVSGNNHVGGLLGHIEGGTVSQSYAMGKVAAVGARAGGLIGHSSGGTVSDSFWDLEASEQLDSAGAGAIGLSANGMRDYASFSDGLDIETEGGVNTVWRIYDGYSTPLLRAFLTQATVGAVNISRTYDGQAFSGNPGQAGEGFNADWLLYGGNAFGAVNAGHYSAILYSHQRGYDLTGSNVGTLTINKAPLNIRANNDSYTYNRISYSGDNGVTYSGWVNGENASVLNGDLQWSGTAQGAIHAGEYSLLVNGLTADNYDITYTPGTLTINKAVLTLSAVADSRVYSGNTESSGTVVVDGLLDGDNLNGLRQEFDSRHAGGRILRVAEGYVIDDGNGGGNYTVAFEEAAGTISRRELVIEGTTVQDREYDAGNIAHVLAGTLGNLVDGESLDLIAIGVFDDANAGDRIATVSYTLSDGNSGLADNYVLTDTTHNARISQRILTVDGTSVSDRVYDGTRAAPVSAGRLVNMVDGEQLVLEAHGIFDNANAGDRTARVSYTLNNGSDGLASNYVLATDTDQLNAAIQRRVLTVESVSVLDREYDGTRQVELNGGTLINVVDGEHLVLGASGMFDDSNVGYRTATVNYRLVDGSNGLASNYMLAAGADTDTINATILRRVLTIDGTSVVNREYDGTALASVRAGTLINLVDGEQLVLDANGVFDNANAGSRTATVNYVLGDGGNGLASNYALAASAETVNAMILRRVLTVDGTSVASRAYNGTATANVSAGALTNLLGDEEIVITAKGIFDSPHAGDRTAIVNYTLSDGRGGLASNYVLEDTTHDAIITPVSVTLHVSAQDKIFDGTTGVTLAGDLSGILPGDDVTVALEGAFIDAQAENDKIVLLNTALMGSDAGNYLLNVPTLVRASISHYEPPAGYEDSLASLVQTFQPGRSTASDILTSADASLVSDISLGILNVPVLPIEDEMTLEELLARAIAAQRAVVKEL